MNNTNYTIHEVLNTTGHFSNSRQQTAQHLAWAVIVLLTNGLGAIANVILLLTMAIHKPLRESSSCILIVHCIAIDLYTTAVAVPARVSTQYSYPATLEEQKKSCKYLALMVQTAYPAGMYAASILALQRLAAVILPHQFASFRGRLPTLCMIIIPWISAFAVIIPYVVEVGINIIPNSLSSGGGCTYTSTSFALKLLLAAFNSYVPTGVMGVAYVVILVKSSYDTRGKKISRTLQRRLEISRTLCLSFLWHCLSIYPASIVYSFYGERVSESLLLVVKYLSSSFSAINPIFFWASSKLFQDGIREVLAGRWIRNRSASVHVIPPVISNCV